MQKIPGVLPAAVFSGKHATRLVAACKWMFALRFNSESAYPATSARMAECYVAKQICSCVYNTAVIIFVKPNASLSDTRSWRVWGKRARFRRAARTALAGNALMDQCVGASCTPPKRCHKSQLHSPQRTLAPTAEDG